MCSKCIFGILASHCGFYSSILDVYFPYSFKINQINIFDLNIELIMETVLRKHKVNDKTFQKIPNTHTKMEEVRKKNQLFEF